MPRRPSKGLGKKQKKAAARSLNRADASIKKWNTIDDIPLDEEEQCKPFLFHVMFYFWVV
jgi:hypothetical protein